MGSLSLQIPLVSSPEIHWPEGIGPGRLLLNLAQPFVSLSADVNEWEGTHQRVGVGVKWCYSRKIKIYMINKTKMNIASWINLDEGLILWN